MNNILEIKNLSVEYQGLKENNESILAVNDVSLKIYEDEIYAIAGESGCGKTTIAKAITKLVKPKCGEILLNGVNINDYKRKEYSKLVQMVFQNPYSSLNPRMCVKNIIKEPLDINTNLTNKEKNDAVINIAESVGIKENLLKQYPHEFSGGQRQRIAIARALILKPKLLIADEPVSALDASIQAQIINLLRELKNELHLSVIFISHDMNVIKYLADRTGIMNFGKLTEENYTSTLFKYPKEDYTKKLLSAVPNFKIIN